jgi:hypothetical protein
MPVNTRLRAASFVMVATLLAMAPAGQPVKPDRDLRGVWTLQRQVRNGREVPMNALMLISRTHYARITVERDRPRFPEGFEFRKPEALTADQQRFVAALFPRSNSNGGTYRVSGNTFYFTAFAHQNPNAEGGEFRRTFELQGNRLELVQEGDRAAEEIWERVERWQ